jgi:hypothetical protein
MNGVINTEEEKKRLRKTLGLRKVSCKFWDCDTKTYATAEGLFHQWGNDFIELESGAGNFSVGIVELSSGKIVLPRADDVQFLKETEA